MKEFDAFLKTVADGLRSLANVVETISEKVESFEETREEPQEERVSEPSSKAEPEVKKPAEATKKTKTVRKPRRRKVTRPSRSATAAEAVYDVIAAHKSGIDTADLMVETGYDEKKVRNIIYKLKKQGRIKTAKRGVYVVT